MWCKFGHLALGYPQSFLLEGRVVGPCWEKLKPKGPKGRKGFLTSQCEGLGGGGDFLLSVRGISGPQGE